MGKHFRAVALGIACAALGFAAALPLVIWGSDKSPEFYGAFAAALIAAAALILSFYYQDTLTRERDDKLHRQERIARAIDLCFWLYHCESELEFISQTMTRMRDKMVQGNPSKLDMPPGQFREVISSHFFEELLDRTKSASMLPATIAATITDDIYRTYTMADRILKMRGAAPDFTPSLENLDQYILILGRRRKKLLVAAAAIESYLIGTGAILPVSDADEAADISPTYP